MRSLLLRCMLIVIVFITSRPGVSQGQLYEDDACVLGNGVAGNCKKVLDCPRVMNSIASGIVPITCSYDRVNPIICCPTDRSQRVTVANPNYADHERATPATERAESEPSHGIRTTSSVYRRPPTNHAEQFRTTPSTIRTKTSSSAATESPSAVGARSALMCEYYSQFVFELIQSPVLLPQPEWFNDSQCTSRVYQPNQKPMRDVSEALFKEYPHIARLGYGNEDDIAWLCAGSLISERFILTTARCISSPNRGKVRWVRVADLNPMEYVPDSTENRKVVEILQHDVGPTTTSDASYGGVALLKLERDVVLRGLARPACLYNQSGNPPGHSFATSIGWGITDWNDTTSTELLMTKDLTLQPQCSSSSNQQRRSRRQLRRQSTGDARTICASDPFPGPSSRCVGDSGGPLQIMLESPNCMHSIVGLTTSGPKACADGTRSAVYIRVSNYISWIENKVWP